MHRFYIPPESWNPESLALDAKESHHCTDVLRLQPGTRVVAFNGRGEEVTAEILKATGDSVLLKTLHRQQSPPLTARITLGQAIPKGKNMELIIQKAVELGAAAIVPLISERTIVRLDADEAAARTEKWQQTVVEAGKQSGQNWLPEVSRPRSPKEFFQEKHDYDLMLIGSLQNDSRQLREVLETHCEEHDGKLPSNVLILVGPEGDFTPAELSLARSNGTVPITLGPIVLRTETAAFFCLSVLSYELRR